ncbi:hypothetical protein [Pseudoponticoccus marisrubri]|uniref:Nitrile hydratase accessory protein n=1 Tax=Pseudoponticoccus marisrubri TaxID=1685382 RepID=A0A0W7WKA9_9RHOB|nr:hypothetical protein [Pseudoponticoccus marisrubri]KUF11052.1 hypothetical protein AVJ23_08320 [Pseudoponticoccus marisrubri]
MSRPEPSARAALRQGRGETAFAEQWHAEVVAVVEVLVADGRLDPGAWSQALGAELERRAADGAPDSDATYYAAFLAVLEQLLDGQDLAPSAEVERRTEEWRRAYHATPHGQPVRLAGQND